MITHSLLMEAGLDLSCPMSGSNYQHLGAERSNVDANYDVILQYKRRSAFEIGGTSYSTLLVFTP